MTLSDALAAARVRVERIAGDAEVTGVSDDTRTIRRGELFVCRPNTSRDTHALLPAAQESGANAVLAHSEQGFDAARASGMPAAWLPATGSRFHAATGAICRVVYGDPSATMRVIAVTGTNGKTTTASILRDALAGLGRRAAYMGTLGWRDPSAGLEKMPNTTPFPAEIWRRLADAQTSGVEDVVLEASSFGLVERRLAGVSFDVGIFTNLTQDHLDYHADMRAYAEAKKLLFTEYAAASCKPFVGVIDDEDPTGHAWLADLPCATYPVSHAPIDVCEVGLVSIAMRVAEHSVQLPLGGHFHATNARYAVAALLALGYAPERIAAAMEQVEPVRGRFERVPNDSGIEVIVDYAHTPDGLSKLLESLRALTHGRVITVFGCGGDRDRDKRPKMAAVVGSLSDVAVVTADNPRTEDLGAILRDIEGGFPPDAEHVGVPDRAEAVSWAIARAAPGDVVVIAGKGHEDYQIVGTTKHPNDDRAFARAALEARRRP